MGNWENKSNNDIILETKMMEQEYEALKSKLISDFNRLEEIEREYSGATRVLINRLKI